MIESTAKRQNPMVRKELVNIGGGIKTAQWQKQKLSLMLKNELAERRENAVPG